MISPDGIVRLLFAPLDKMQQHQIRFTSRAAQSAYFAGLVRHTYSELSFTKKDRMIRVPANIDTLWDSNYVMYDNVTHGSRMFYAFIDRMEWLSENATAVYLKTDVYQTWMQECTFKRCFVEREHVSDDSIGLHIVDEGLQLGEFVQNSVAVKAGLGDMDIVLASTLSDEQISFGGTMINNIYQGCGFYGQHGTSLSSLNSMLSNFITAGKEAAIVAIYMTPHLFSNFPTEFSLWSESQFQDLITINGPAQPASIDGYTPRNKKLLTHPYSFLYAHNNGGAAAVFRFEFFGGTPQFEIIGSPLPGSNFKMYPVNLNVGGGEATLEDYDQGLTLSGFPLCSWVNDAYKSWLAQNSMQSAIGVAGGILAIGAGAVLGNGIAVAGGVLSVMNTLANIASQSIQPPQAQGNLNSGGANCATEVNDFFLQSKSIRYEQAQILDEFFDMYGYKVNRVKMPNMSGRLNWNYVRTIDANIVGDIPQDDLVELKQIFDKGVTLWHTAANIGDYSLSNVIPGS